MSRLTNRLMLSVLTSVLSIAPVLGQANEHKLNPATGLIDTTGHNMVAAHCTACHSAKLISQNKMSRERWLDTIRWMQSTQKLWPLGDAEPVILDYLTTWYGPKTQSRRAPIPAHLMPKESD
ncbi:hypothetical protein [Alteromonas lipotrueae]|uniref:hypothetical protein n=1 Tax=Alteromonas lipotrueae TaxID=2803814 RepID=UPI001C46D201|nr:hypothetical protein [Alteromonas lipotrueae]